MDEVVKEHSVVGDMDTTALVKSPLVGICSYECLG